MLNILIWIVFWTIISLTLLCIIAYLILPWIFKRFVSPLFNASYKFDSQNFNDKNHTANSPQNNQPQIIFNEESGIYNILFGEGRTFSKGIVKVRHEQKVFSNLNDSNNNFNNLIIKKITKEKKEDKFGQFKQTKVSCELANTDIEIILTIRKYIQKSFVTFTLSAPKGLKDMATGTYEDLITGFPSFYNESPNTNVFTYRHAIFCPPSRKIDATSAPVVLYDDDLNCVIISPLDGFLNTAISEDDDGRINCGIQGEITELPKGYSQTFILYFGKGINKPMEELGDILLEYHGSHRKSQYADIVCSHLGFWTDNGAYYYYKTEKGMNYEDTLVAVRKYFEQEDIPIKYFNFDSWWYLKHTNKVFTTIFRPIVRLMGGGLYGNTLRWETDPEKFSTDLKTFYNERFKLPITAHNRRWDSRSPYLDEYEFITYKNHACPLEKKFWVWLMQHAKESGIEVYEQDWMKNQIDSMPHLRQNINAVGKWLDSMAIAANENNVNVFYCMQTPAILLYSIKHPNITITRCSGDYNHRWPLTYRYVHSTQTNIIINTVGLNSHPDAFRSCSMEKSFTRLFGEKYPVFKCLYQSLNAGVVAPGDKKENVNGSLLKKTCRKDGLLYKSDKALTANDLMFKPHRKYYICDTYIKRGNHYWRLVLVSNIWPWRVKDFSITPQELGFEREEYILYDYFEDTIEKISKEQKIEVGKLAKYGYRYYIFAPIFSNGMAVIGSTNKFVPCSKKQYPRIKVQNEALELTIEELEGQTVPILLYAKNKPKAIQMKDGTHLKEGTRNNTWSYDIEPDRITISLSFEHSGTKTILIKH